MPSANQHTTPMDTDFLFARYYLPATKEFYCLSYFAFAKTWIVGFWTDKGLDYSCPPETFDDFTAAAKFYLTQLFDGEDDAVQNSLNNLHNPPADPIDGVFDDH